LSSILELNELIELLKTQSDPLAARVIQKLRAYGKAAVGPLLESVTDTKTHPFIRNWGLEALGAIGDTKAIPILLAALEEEKMTVKLHALRAIRHMKCKKAVKKILPLLRDKSGGIRVNALYTLSAIGDKSAILKVQAMLKDPQWYVRQAACEALAEMKATKAKSALEKISQQDDRKAVREAAERALKMIG